MIVKATWASLALCLATANSALEPSPQLENIVPPQPTVAVRAGTAETDSFSIQRSKSVRSKLSIGDSVINLPFEVVLISRSKYYQGGCRGSLIAPNIVLTTASCLMNQDFKLNPASGYYVIMAYDYGTDTVNSQTYEAYKLYPHPDFTPVNTTANIGLIALKESLPLSKAVPAEIYDQEISDSLKVQTSGFYLDLKKPRDLRTISYTDVEISNSASCSIASLQRFESKNSSICAINTGAKDYCFFQIGMALVTADSRPKKLVGVFNRLALTSPFPDLSCYRNDTLSFYTPLKAYTSWIGEQRKAIDVLPEVPFNTTFLYSQGSASSSPSKLGAFKAKLSPFTLISMSVVFIAVTYM